MREKTNNKEVEFVTLYSAAFGFFFFLFLACFFFAIDFVSFLFFLRRFFSTLYRWRCVRFPPILFPVFFCCCSCSRAVLLFALLSLQNKKQKKNETR